VRLNTAPRSPAVLLHAIDVPAIDVDEGVADE
jgi:hypothetical protein